MNESKPIVKMAGMCRIYGCTRKARVLIIHEDSKGKIHIFRECLEHASDWEDVDDVVLIFEG